MSLIKKIKQFINGSWQEFQLDANNIDNVATREWVTNVDKTIIGDTTLDGDIILAGGVIRLTNEVILDGSEIYYNGQYVGDFHPNAPYAYANKQWVESLVTNQVQYLGIVNSIDDIRDAFIPDNAVGKAGDFVRAGSSFTIETETVHPGDIIIANNVTPSISLANYDIVHTEDPGNYVTLATNQTISGYKKFNGGIGVPHEHGVGIMNYGYHGITQEMGAANSVSYLFPNKPGTFALLSDIPTNYVTTDTSQTITGAKFISDTATSHQGPIEGISLMGHDIYVSATDLNMNSEGIYAHISPGSMGMYAGMYSSRLGVGKIYNNNADLLLPNVSGTFATQEWVKANTICSSTIDQEFFNSLY